MKKPFDPTIKENWQYHDEYEFWYMPYPRTDEAQAEEGVRWRGFKPWEEATKREPVQPVETCRGTFEKWLVDSKSGYGGGYTGQEWQVWKAAWNAATATKRESGDLKSIRAALEFYANPSDYVSPLTGGLGKLYFDCGEKAKEGLSALSQIEDGGSNGSV